MVIKSVFIERFTVRTGVDSMTSALTLNHSPSVFWLIVLWRSSPKISHA